ncbi:hypothetical protein SKAU_G00098820 [Synaphobranchus kaupii]|uniref:Uncharacterized protein n=1 Tax=Synaphobranchus kaupii TaxID=118154 RepID=A0A9Q1FYQ9_SYNKA|nr:hypothetical protein SKAU_G00098820 [Synaphobranchus kaupii]
MALRPPGKNSKRRSRLVMDIRSGTYAANSRVAGRGDGDAILPCHRTSGRLFHPLTFQYGCLTPRETGTWTRRAAGPPPVRAARGEKAPRNALSFPARPPRLFELGRLTQQ